MALKPLYSIVWLVLTAGSSLLLFFIILAGSKEAFPLNDFYWLQADTSKIPGAPKQARWTPYGVCDTSSDSRNINCTKNKADFPFDPANNFGTHTGVPADFINSRNTYYFLSRFSYPFFLIGLAFSVLTFLFSFLAIGSRLASGLAALFSFIGMLFTAAAASLATSFIVLAHHQFSKANLEVHYGVKLIAFAWASFFILLLSFFMFCCGCCRNRRNNDRGGLAPSSSFEKSDRAKGGFFRSVGKKDNPQGFFDSESQQPVIERSSFERGGPHEGTI